MTTYRLPDGIEVPRADDDGLVRGAGVWVEHPVYGTIAVERNRLTEVKPPPLPPEPYRDGTPWLDPQSADIWRGLGDGWYEHSNDFGHRWSEVCEKTDPSKWVRLVPDPADDAPALPWTLDSCRRSASVGTPKHGTVVVDVPGIDYTPGELEQIARALLAAARAAREVETP